MATSVSPFRFWLSIIKFGLFYLGFSLIGLGMIVGGYLIIGGELYNISGAELIALCNASEDSPELLFQNFYTVLFSRMPFADIIAPYFGFQVAKQSVISIVAKLSIASTLCYFFYRIKAMLAKRFKGLVIHIAYVIANAAFLISGSLALSSALVVYLEQIVPKAYINVVYIALLFLSVLLYRIFLLKTQGDGFYAIIAFLIEGFFIVLNAICICFIFTVMPCMYEIEALMFIYLFVFNAYVILIGAQQLIRAVFSPRFLGRGLLAALVVAALAMTISCVAVDCFVNGASFSGALSNLFDHPLDYVKVIFDGQFPTADALTAFLDAIKVPDIAGFIDGIKCIGKTQDFSWTAILKMLTIGLLATFLFRVFNVLNKFILPLNERQKTYNLFYALSSACWIFSAFWIAFVLVSALQKYNLTVAHYIMAIGVLLVLNTVAFYLKAKKYKVSLFNATKNILGDFIFEFIATLIKLFVSMFSPTIWIIGFIMIYVVQGANER